MLLLQVSRLCYDSTMKRVITQPSTFRSLKEFPVSRCYPALVSRPASSQPQSHPQRELAGQKSDSLEKREAATANNGGKKKTTAEMDAELKQKMSGLSGDGGEAGVEYENGQPVAMKRGVKNNMFRYI
ncbi:hypothetical protein GGR52DRAFT_557989 [Hypoxylon sp. FL1284]|nr:hypothetical protein GGR52DRAFT_557989 [Hypoxylon sp. FL1284]